LRGPRSTQGRREIGDTISRYAKVRSAASDLLTIDAASNASLTDERNQFGSYEADHLGAETIQDQMQMIASRAMVQQRRSTASPFTGNPVGRSSVTVAGTQFA
jgi:hypothetical protein